MGMNLERLTKLGIPNINEGKETLQPVHEAEITRRRTSLDNESKGTYYTLGFSDKGGRGPYILAGREIDLKTKTVIPESIVTIFLSTLEGYEIKEKTPA